MGRQWRRWRRRERRTVQRYGILNEQSDLRVHICPTVRRVYVYETSKGVEAVESGKYPARVAGGVGSYRATARGVVLPPFEIEGCTCVQVSDKVWDFFNFLRSDTTSAKGAKAQAMALEMIHNGQLPLPAMGEGVVDRALQIAGQDIVIGGAVAGQGVRIQVKCDFNGGDKALGGTGNLFLQTHERNPGKHY